MTPKRHRPKCVRGQTLVMNSPCGKLYVTLNNDPQTQRLMEVFVRFGKSGTCASLVANALTMVTSYGLRSGMEVGDAVKALLGHGCHRPPVEDEGEMVNSCVDAIGRAIRLHAQSGQDTERITTHGDQTRSLGGHPA